MKLNYIEITYNKLNMHNQRIDFDIDKMCIIGENGVGKTTILRMLNKVFSKGRYDYDIKGLKDISYRINCSFTDSEMNSILSDFVSNEVNSFDIYKKNKEGYRFQSNLIDDYYDNLKKKVYSSNKSYVELYKKLCGKYKSYMKSNSYDGNLNKPWPDKNYIYYHYIEGKLENDNAYKNGYFDYNKPRVSFYKTARNVRIYTNKGELDSDIEMLKELFPDYIHEIPSNYAKLTKEFNANNEDIYSKLNKCLDDVCIYGEKLNSIFEYGGSLHNLINDFLETRTILLSTYITDYRDLNNLLLASLLENYKYDTYMQYYKEFTKHIDDLKDNPKIFIRLSSLLAKKMNFYNIDELEENIDDGFDIEQTNEYIEINKDIEKTLKNLEQVLMERNFLKDFKDHFSKLFFQIDNELIEKIIKDLNESIPSFEDSNIEEFYLDFVDENYLIAFKERRRDNKTYLSKTSLGRQWYLTYKAVLNNLREGDILLIDEPASYLHLNAQREILNEIMEIKNKVIYSTHTPYMIPYDFQAKILYLRNKNDLEIIQKDLLIPEDIINIFGLSNLRDFILMGYRTQYLIPYEFKRTLLDNNILLDVNNSLMHQGVDKLKAIIVFLTKYVDSFVVISDLEHIEKYISSGISCCFLDYETILQKRKATGEYRLSKLLEGITYE